LEVDGEYWHRKSFEQFNRDKLKERLAIEHGYLFVRISDKDWVPNIIFESQDKLEIHNSKIMKVREEIIPKHN
jgi:uncharacterized protein (DUF1919 family)